MLFRKFFCSALLFIFVCTSLGSFLVEFGLSWCAVHLLIAKYYSKSGFHFNCSQTKFVAIILVLLVFFISIFGHLLSLFKFLPT